MDKANVQSAFDRNSERFIADWKQLLRFPSISADPRHNDDCAKCARWLAEWLSTSGFDSRLLETASKPVVFAERKGSPVKPTVLFYGHYDVQPADPLDDWITPPFEPTIKDGRLYARGAQDNKGQLLYSLEAMETLIRARVPLCTLKVVLEGEEESGSQGISSSLEQWKDFLSADVLMIADTRAVSSGAPTITMGLRGIIGLAVTLEGAACDLHSGTHGGVAPNPAHELSALVAGLHKPDGSIAVPGYYDGVTPPTERERSLANAVPFDPLVYESETGVPPMAGEKTFTPAERSGFRPSIDVNGIYSGYIGEGMKTIIPASATAKITSRVVPGQNPESCLEAIVRYLRRNVPAGLHFRVTDKAAVGGALRLNPDSPLVQSARNVLRRITGDDPALLWEGASIPIIPAVARVSGSEPLLVGFAGEQDKAHAPNESFSIGQFRLGYVYTALMLSELAS